MPYHFLCAYNLTEAARDLVLVRISNTFRLRDVPRFEMQARTDLLVQVSCHDRGPRVRFLGRHVYRACSAVLCHHFDACVRRVPPVICTARRNRVRLRVMYGYGGGTRLSRERSRITRNPRHHVVDSILGAANRLARTHHEGVRPLPWAHRCGRGFILL